MNPAGHRDARFADPAWQRSPLYRRLGQAYLTAEQAITALAGRAGPDWRTRERARLAASLLTSALAPTNTLPGNPAALRRAAGTGGHSLLRGARNLLTDVRAGRRVPSQADTRPFRLGDNLGATPGAVVFRNDVLELIQYSPATPQVHAVPLLMVWSLINRYYILDLAPGRSFIEYAVGQGLEVFVTSWRNPGREHAGWDLDRYAAALAEAMDAVTAITGSRQLGTMGMCAGGQLLAALLGHLAALGDDRVAYACLAASQLDMSVPSLAGLALAPPLPALARLATRATGRVDGRDIAACFARLRPGELVWGPWVNNYLLGQDPPAHDILAWNAGSHPAAGRGRPPAAGHGGGQPAGHPGRPPPARYPRRPVRATVPGYVIGAETDHLVPWRRLRQHPAARRRDQFRAVRRRPHPAPGQPARQPEGALPHRPRPAASQPAGGPRPSGHQGSWWGHWADWVRARSGAPRPGPGHPGQPALPAPEPAPGRYAREP